MLAASEQPASLAGSSTVLSGLRILAVSAMKRTPQKTIGSCRSRRPAAQLQGVAGEIGDGVEQRRFHVVVSQDHGVALRLEAVDLVGNARPCGAARSRERRRGASLSTRQRGLRGSYSCSPMGSPVWSPCDPWLTLLFTKHPVPTNRISSTRQRLSPSPRAIDEARRSPAISLFSAGSAPDSD